MYQILSESQKRSLREQFEAKQEYMVAYNAINVCGERYDDLSPEEIWNEALDVVKEISESPHREWKVKKLYSQLKRRYSTFEDEFGECITRTPKQQEITAMLVLFDVVCMLSLAKHVDPEDAPKHPYYNYMVEIVSFFNDSILFQAMLAVLSHDEEEIENMTRHELQEVDYLDGLQDINDDEKDVDLRTADKERVSRMRKTYQMLLKMGDKFTGKSQWFYIYRMLADHKVYDDNSYTLFYQDLIDAGVKKEHLPDTSTFSRKQKLLRAGITYPYWKVIPGKSQSVLKKGLALARIAFQVFFLKESK